MERGKMKSASIVLSAACLLALASVPDTGAQTPITNGCSSAGSVVSPVKFNCDFAGEPGDSVFLRHRGQSDTAFFETAMIRVGDIPDYEFTFEKSLDFTLSPGVLEYYFYARRDTLLATQSPKNANNQYPPASYKYAHFMPDAQGDMAPGSLGNWLDLTSSGMTYSDTRLFCYLRNVSGTWPQNELFDYFVYTMGFMIASETDSSFYALVYANVPLLLSTGLYVLEISDSTFTRIGNINAAINNGALHMACDLSAFAADPGWPGWPPPQGYIFPVGATLTAGLSGQYANDNTYPSLYQPRTQYLDFTANGPPWLSSPRIDFDSESLISSVAYHDPENNLPVTRLFHLDSNTSNMSSPDHSYADSAAFGTALGAPGEGWHRYYFEFSDGVLTAATEVDSFHVFSGQCQYVPGDINNVPPANGIDVTYGVAYLKGGNPPPVACPACPQPQPFYAAMDVNGTCSTNGIDITYFVAFLKGGPGLMYCPECPPVP
jgi:hypothetical protein